MSSRPIETMSREELFAAYLELEQAHIHLERRCGQLEEAMNDLWSVYGEVASA